MLACGLKRADPVHLAASEQGRPRRRRCNWGAQRSGLLLRRFVQRGVVGQRQLVASARLAEMP